MVDVSGDFEIHITTYAHHSEQLASFAERHRVKFFHVLLDRGVHVSQPMLTLTGQGTLDRQRSLAKRWNDRMREAGMYPCRTKIEATPWSDGVPQTDPDAAAEPGGRYFEHHIKVLLSSVTVPDLMAITDLVASHGARLSRNARRQRAGGAQERFVNQRCHGVGLATAKQRLDKLVTELHAAGYEVLTVEQEYVVFDSNLEHDSGWLSTTAPDGWAFDMEARMRAKPAGSEYYPPTYQPLPPSPVVRQTAAFDPAMKQYSSAYRPGEPTFLAPAAGRRWTTARRTGDEPCPHRHRRDQVGRASRVAG
ncbi:hypothetical protein OG792_08580 [Micromonospora sp. NBC_01699]|uniref:hypothetical protein n=1 Tax=Micromonospora sp. NBC_01699 TaxID=2975984 RepID=UPI002E334685|nr:hypothetical protein [Micromonospora sp. NBC_01699]